ncbi:hypothetical protein PoB_004052600 [Plakobranchus ocellatus]|uniref:Uncharacterized protein n=1 Tax=Plakobranchus ocellatus TaxID=259542 RepID=A0AAV4ASC2_9GAST|nr:hypothetical protein PoB_004052600 [Plakobranchus ocellatus]
MYRPEAVHGLQTVLVTSCDRHGGSTLSQSPHGKKKKQGTAGELNRTIAIEREREEKTKQGGEKVMYCERLFIGRLLRPETVQ